MSYNIAHRAIKVDSMMRDVGKPKINITAWRTAKRSTPIYFLQVYVYEK